VVTLCSLKFKFAAEKKNAETSNKFMLITVATANGPNPEEFSMPNGNWP